jgi:acetyltransferase-like isoleucine patch superfamily enzyme
VSAELIVGERMEADDGVIVGYPPSQVLTAGFTLGPDARLRSGTVIYRGTRIGRRFQTGHHVIVREITLIGDDVSIWSNTVVDYGCVIGDRVKIHSNCYIAQFTEIEDDAFLAPGVTIANDLFPGDAGSAKAMRGPLIKAGAQIGVNATILPYVTIGAGAIVGAGSVVTKDIPPGVVAYGSPARPARRVPDGAEIRVRLERAFAMRADAASRTNGHGHDQHA